LQELIRVRLKPANALTGLGGIGETHLVTGDTDQGVTHLHQARSTFQRLARRASKRVSMTSPPERFRPTKSRWWWTDRADERVPLGWFGAEAELDVVERKRLGWGSRLRG
jgi:hypothetical protein